MRQHNSRGQWLQQLHEPLVAGSGFDHHLKRRPADKICLDLFRLIAARRPPPQHLTLVAGSHQNTHTDNLLVEVDADEVHDSTPSVENGCLNNTQTTGLPRTRRNVAPAASPL